MNADCFRILKVSGPPYQGNDLLKSRLSRSWALLGSLQYLYGIDIKRTGGIDK